MGAGVSSVMGLKEDAGGRAAGLGDLPENCVAAVLAHLDQPEICRAARLSRTFRGAASADLVWETKLPRNYRYLLALASDEKSPDKKSCLCKKEIYARLCQPIPFDGGTKEIWLEKTSGGICMSISSKALLITGIDDRRYWNYIPTAESRFHTVAYLHQTWWFEVDGEIDFCFPAGSYSLFFRLHLGCATKRLALLIVDIQTSSLSNCIGHCQKVQGNFCNGLNSAFDNSHSWFAENPDCRLGEPFKNSILCLFCQ